MLGRLALLVAAGCGRIGFSTTGLVGDARGDASSAVVQCPAPPPIDVSTPDRTIGLGTPASCTDSEVRAALAAGGVIAFDCGGGPVTIPLLGELDVPPIDTVLYGPGITLDGGGTARVLETSSTATRLTLIGLTITGGQAAGSGAGVEVQAGSLLVIDGKLTNNHGPLTDPNLAGGAIAVHPGATAAIYRTTFDGNSSANGGAISVYSDLTLVDSVLTHNTATGNGGNTVAGGLGGAIEAVGMASDTFCGLTIADNTAGSQGGGILRISTDRSGSDHWSLTRITGNRALDAAGGAYIQDIAIDLRDVVVAGNAAGNVAGLWYIGATGPFVADSMIVANNTATSGLGAGLSLGGVPGSISFSTIAGNYAMCSACWSAAIDGGGQTLTASVIADNKVDAPNEPVSCKAALVGGGNNFQWPVMQVGGGTDDPGALCASDARVVDPMIGALGSRTGPAGTFDVVAPLPGSPVIGAVTSCPAVDLLGNPRPQPCSAGAVEP